MQFPRISKIRRHAAFIIFSMVLVANAGCACSPTEAEERDRQFMWLLNMLFDKSGPVQITAEGAQGFLYLATEVKPDSSPDKSPSAPLLQHQLFQIGPPSPQGIRRMRRLGSGWYAISALQWHDHKLHVMHGPSYTVFHDEDRDGFMDRQEDVSPVGLGPPVIVLGRSGPIDPAEYLEVLADPKMSNADRIEALWMLRALSFSPGEIVMLPPGKHEIDPTKAFITALHNGPEPLRAEAARVLRVSPKDTAPAIKGLIHRAKNDTSARVRTEAALTLGYLKAKEAAAELFGSLDDPDDGARMAKIMALRTMNEWELSPAYFSASSERIREGAILTLAGVEDESAIKALASALQTCAYPEMRIQIVQALEIAYFFTRAYEVRGSAGQPFKPPQWQMVQTVNPFHEHDVIRALLDARKDEDAALQEAAGDATLRIMGRERKLRENRNTDLKEIGVVE